MRPAILIGSAPCLDEDLMKLKNIIGRDLEDVFDFIAVGMDAADKYLGKIIALSTLHFADVRDAKKRRESVGGNMDFTVITHLPCENEPNNLVFPYEQPSGSSALHAALAAIHLGYDRIVLAGCPLDTGVYARYQKGWIHFKDKVIDNVRSMSGWTAEFLGEPNLEWMKL